MSFLELSPEAKAAMKSAEVESVKGFHGESSSLAHHAQDLLKAFAKTQKVEVDLEKLSLLPQLEIAMSHFQPSGKTEKVAKVEPKAEPQLADPKLGSNPEIQPEPIQQGSVLDAALLGACTTRDQHYEKYIVRNAKGLVHHGKDDVPSFDYDVDGQLKKVTTQKGTIVLRPTTYTRREDGKWVDDDGTVTAYDFSVNQTTGELTQRYESKEETQWNRIYHKRIDGTSYTTDLSGKQLQSTSNGDEHRHFAYDQDGNLTSVRYRRDSQNPFGQDFRDSWKRQSDGTWLNLDRDGKPTQRRLKDIQCYNDGTYLEVDFPCNAKVFPLEPPRGR